MARRRTRWLFAPLLVVAVLVVELALLRDRIERDVEVLRQAARPAPAANAGRVPAPPVPVLAPPRAGPVAEVNLRALQRCDPGGPCQVRVLAQTTAPAGDLHWTYRIVDRCGGAVWEAPGGSSRLPPGAHGVAAVDNLALPPARALAVIALVSAEGPDTTAASEPLRVPARGTC